MSHALLVVTVTGTPLLLDVASPSSVADPSPYVATAHIVTDGIKDHKLGLYSYSLPGTKPTDCDNQ
jgi:hypothetical protein